MMRKRSGIRTPGSDFLMVTCLCFVTIEESGPVPGWLGPAASRNGQKLHPVRDDDLKSQTLLSTYLFISKAIHSFFLIYNIPPDRNTCCYVGIPPPSFSSKCFLNAVFQKHAISQENLLLGPFCHMENMIGLLNCGLVTCHSLEGRLTADGWVLPFSLYPLVRDSSSEVTVGLGK